MARVWKEIEVGCGETVLWAEVEIELTLGEFPQVVGIWCREVRACSESGIAFRAPSMEELTAIETYVENFDRDTLYALRDHALVSIDDERSGAH